MKEPEKTRVLNVFNDLDKRLFMGNLFAHDNPEAERVHIDEVRRFAESVHELKQALSCVGCGEYLIYKQDLGRIMCSNKKCDKPQMILCK